MTAALNTMIARLRAVEGAGERVAARAGPRVLDWIKQQAAAGVSPNGAPWKPTLKGETAKLGRKLSVQIVKDSIVILLGGKSFLHHTGRARGKISRKVIPGAGAIPEPARAILTQETRAVLSKILAGKG